MMANHNYTMPSFDHMYYLKWSDLVCRHIHYITNTLTMIISSMDQTFLVFTAYQFKRTIQHLSSLLLRN